MSDSYTSSSYYYSSTTNTTDGSTTTGHRYTTTSHTDTDGNTVVRTAHQDLGQPAVIEERRYDRTGQEQKQLPFGTSTIAGGVRRITDLEDETGATTYDAGTAYGAPVTSERRESESESESVAGSSSYDTGPSLYRARTYNPDTGAYEERNVEYGSDAVPRYRRDRGRGHAARSGYTAGERASREFETDQGTRLKRETDVNMSDVVG